ncbi:TPA: shikimate kinase [Streptococcus suis]|uniref:Shikimate kinase n=2 Tax=Streptococcus suis TaxID=1307 RepID=A0A0M9FHH0_STRSU|nr:shikimate kinase [Streptococcus suis]ASW51239.1 shikimate kinase [Streptococcus suis]KPA67337.1 shikimate kinase [Streptococcus suis]MBO8112336.1 shikimate kinase [Streptococcus suis]MBS8079900.1 shikimate kinase [Streptococcus suis]MBS8091199.1 shikimate kinase [Streptococcus suis]
MNLVIIGAQASGKMTIGQEVERLTDLVLFHNHESIDFVTKFFPMSDEARELINDIRMKFFETSAKTDLGLIFTVVIDFNDPADISFLEQIQAIYHSRNQAVLFIELETDLQERLRRNVTENRLQHKPWKRNIEWSEKDILDTMKFANFNPEFAPKQLDHYLKINNTRLSANDVAQLIIQKMEELEQEQTK